MCASICFRKSATALPFGRVNYSRTLRELFVIIIRIVRSICCQHCAGEKIKRFIYQSTGLRTGFANQPTFRLQFRDSVHVDVKRLPYLHVLSPEYVCCTEQVSLSTFEQHDMGLETALPVGFGR